MSSNLGVHGGSQYEVFLFDPGAERIGNVYGDWQALMAVIGLLPRGANPVVRVVSTGTFVVPSAGMPPNGWDFNGGSIECAYKATGATVIELPDGVFFDNLSGVNNNIVVKIQPGPLSTGGVFRFSQVPAGGAQILYIALGAAIDHTTTANPAIQSPNGVNPTTMVLALNQSQQGAQPLSGPLLQLNGNDGCVGVQLNCGPAGGLPDGWVVGGGPASGMLDIRSIESRNFSVPGYTGNPPTVINASQAFNLNYTPADLAKWSGVAPTSTADALDRIAAAIGPIP